MEGELINPGGAMTGGAFKNSSNLLSRRREIEEFEKTVALLKADMDEMEQSVNRIKQKRTACYNEMDEIQEKLRKASVIENTAKMHIEQIKADRQRQRSSKRRIGLNKRHLREIWKKILDNEDSIQMELETSESLEQELNRKIDRLNSMLSEDREKEAVQLHTSEEVHLSLAGLEQQKCIYSGKYQPY